MAKSKANTTGKKGGFMEWWESYQGKRVRDCVYSLGASVVLIGALAKLEHYSWASVALMIGMITEAVLFAIGVFDKPHVEYNWQNVFPQLVNEKSGLLPEIYEQVKTWEVPTLLGANVKPISGEGVEIDGKPATGSGLDAKLSDKDVEALSNGIKNLTKTASQLSDLGTLAMATSKFNEKLDAAAIAADKFATAAGNVQDHTDAYAKSMDAISSNLGNLSAVYELQLKNAQAQAEAMKAQTDKANAATKQVEAMTEDMKQAAAAAAAAAANQKAYEAASKQLAEQVANLNKVYGNMLTALA